jgi:hypothetical protein
MPIANDIAFNKERYDKYDGPGKQVAVELLDQLGFFEIVENLGESQGNFQNIWDVKGEHPEVGEWRIESEVKEDWGTKWVDVPFKFHTMDFPFRKRNKAIQHATHMMIVGGDHKRLFIVNREVMLESKVSYKPCRNRQEPEPFFNVDITSPKSAFYFKNKDGNWVHYTNKR